jgi:hypothetical protein
MDKEAKFKLFLSLAVGPFVASIITLVVGAMIAITGVDPLITTGAALETPDIRPLSEIIAFGILAPIPLWSLGGLVFFIFLEA